MKKVLVVGQGYVGLPLAMAAAESGYFVTGIDLNINRIENLNNGISFVEDITNDRLLSATNSGMYRAISNYEEVSDFDIAVITVPTPLHEGLPDLSFIESSMSSIGKITKAGATVVLESTTYPGTTEEIVVPILESESGLKAGIDFFVGYSPERIDPGNQTWSFENTPKVVSGINEESLTYVDNFYRSIVDITVTVSSPKEAELTKLLENTFRHVNIALVNELAIFGNQLGVNVWESINAAATKPFGFMKFEPGPGVGGHCLPIDPSYLSWQVKRQLGRTFRFVELANDVNEHMPDYVVERISWKLNKQGKALSASKVLIVGLSYKKNSSDLREAPSKRIIELLNQQGVQISAVDDLVQLAFWPDNVQRVDLEEVNFSQFDLAVILTKHDSMELSPLVSAGLAILDTRNVVSGNSVEML